MGGERRDQREGCRGGGWGMRWEREGERCGKGRVKGVGLKGVENRAHSTTTTIV